MEYLEFYVGSLGYTTAVAVIIGAISAYHSEREDRLKNFVMVSVMPIFPILFVLYMAVWILLAGVNWLVNLKKGVLK